MPWETPPAAYKPNGLICNEKLDCKCYARKPYDINEECANVGGKCRFPNDPNTADEVMVGGDLCDKDRGCECYRPKANCKNTPKCTKKGGRCFEKKTPIPAGSKHVLVSGKHLKCMKGTDCYCWRVLDVIGLET